MSKAKKQLYAVTPLEMQEARGKYAALPELPNLHDEHLESVVFGPRREMTVKIKPLLWAGNNGFYGPAYDVRFGDIVNYAEVLETFKPRYCKENRLNGIKYNGGQFSKPGDLHLLLSFERIGDIVIHCASVTVKEPEPENKKAA